MAVLQMYIFMKVHIGTKAKVGGELTKKGRWSSTGQKDVFQNI